MATFNPPRDDQGRIILNPVDSPAASGTTEDALSPHQPASFGRTAPTSPEQRPMSELLGTTPPRPSLSRRNLIGIITLAVLVIVPLTVLVMDIQTVPHPALPLTTHPTTTPTPVNLVLSRAIVAWSAPDGAVLGALERDLPYQPLARSGPEWVQIKIDSGLVWVQTADLGEPTAAALPDLATPIPTPTPIPATAVPALQAPICDASSAPHQITRDVFDERHIPIGSITAWSCVSWADAVNHAAVQEAQLRTNVQAMQRAGP